MKDRLSPTQPSTRGDIAARNVSAPHHLETQLRSCCGTVPAKALALGAGLLACAVGFAGGSQTSDDAPPTAKTERVKSADPIRIADLNLEMQPIPAGSFLMGSPESEPGRLGSETQHRVTLTKPFWLGKYEVTQEQYEKLMGNNPSKFKGAKRPVDQVNWDDAMAFCKKLNDRERTAGRLPVGYEYALPTEAQWEYAARAGTTGATYNKKEEFKILAKINAPALDAIAWYGGNSTVNFDASGGSVDFIPKGISEETAKELRAAMQYPGEKAGTHDVGGKAANDFGLHDMLGNVWEWCSDWYGDYPVGDATDPVGAASSTHRIFRGGSWGDAAHGCRSAVRGTGKPAGIRHYCMGFRLALVPVR